MGLFRNFVRLFPPAAAQDVLPQRSIGWFPSGLGRFSKSRHKGYTGETQGETTSFCPLCSCAPSTTRLSPAVCSELADVTTAAVIH